MTYEDIRKANSEVKSIDLKGKEYAMVPERVTAFRKLYPDGFIITDVVSNDGTTVMMQAKVGYYKESGEAVVLGTGFAQEVQGKGMVNGTSHIENCETSAVGRALGFLGLGINGGGICSAEELVNAITAQNQIQNDKKVERPKADKPATVTATPVQQKVGGAKSREDYVQLLHHNAYYVYGDQAEAKLNGILAQIGATLETLTGAQYKQVTKVMDADLASKSVA